MGSGSFSLKRLFRIAGLDGEKVYGSTCAKRITGWTPQLAQAQFLDAVRARVEGIRVQGHGDLYDELCTLAQAEGARWGCANAAGSGKQALMGTWASVKKVWCWVDVERAYELRDAALQALAA